MHFDRLKRREFISLLGGAAAWTLAARAQQAAMPVVGFLNSASAESFAPFVAAFRQGLSEAGYIEGRNVAVEYRWANEQYDRLPALAADLVRRQADVIAANQISVEAAKAATATIPIVFTTALDPVQLGLVAALNRPGGNLTGVTTLNVELLPKRIELLHQLSPTATDLALLVNSTNPSAGALSRDAHAAARSLGLQLHILEASSESDFEPAFTKLALIRVGGLVIGPDPFFVGRSAQLAALALRKAVPTVFAFRQFVSAGGLMSYGGSLTDVYRLAGVYVGRVLKGEKPADLPVHQSTKVELMINLKTAGALGLTLPASLLARADEVIE
jgi:putative tryptophan/tyrosine transport system substrate-binding protein